jgi:hypothetical protein
MMLAVSSARIYQVNIRTDIHVSFTLLKEVESESELKALIFWEVINMARHKLNIRRPLTELSNRQAKRVEDKVCELLDELIKKKYLDVDLTPLKKLEEILKAIDGVGENARPCAWCGRFFTPRHGNQRYCEACREKLNAEYQRRHREKVRKQKEDEEFYKKFNL